MTRFDSPIEEALRAAEYAMQCSIVYSVLNEVGGSKAQRKEWRELGPYHVVQLLVHSARPDWEAYPDAFWIDPWTAQHLRSYEPDGLYYIVDNWLQGAALGERISDDPRVEDSKVRHLRQLLAALNRNV
jgi:hypothetical protein